MTLKEAISQICGIRGIEQNTAHYIAMRALSEPDAFPFADPGIRSSLGTSGHPISAPEVLEIAECWRPWRAYAAMHLSASSDPLAATRAQRA